MKWRLRGRRGPGDGGDADLDARLSEAWEAAAAAVGKTLDIAAGKEALLAGSGLLREGAADLSAPAVPTRGTGRQRRGRLALGSVAGAAALAAGAAALVAVVVPGAGDEGTEGLGHPGNGGSAVTAAYVVQRVDSALSAAGPGEIAQVTVTMDGAASAEEWSYGDQWRSVTYSPSGQPVQDEGFSTSSSVYTLVNYQKRTWTRQHGLGHPGTPVPLVPGSRNCEAAVLPALTWVFRPGLPVIEISASSSPATAASALRGAVSCGSLMIAGRQSINGTEAIELTSRPGSPISETIWVSPDTYLPVRVTARLATIQRTADITWLQPAAQNLPKLTVPIPAGFRQIPLSQAIGPVTKQIPGGPPTPK
jgi:hypothetical protein